MPTVSRPDLTLKADAGAAADAPLFAVYGLYPARIDNLQPWL
ncbi:hypothetical protein BN134_2381 [Cronobacter dublinensis 1210]|uniref:Uncharacterized protein n=1 Tax=Cronobacter dublinensis 1210 TaxID=1208656 RepID=A0ABM9Q821_9ENTR|nr:hypothetical protein BN134_2381 [Cronobacter dublinensis 1210]